MNTLTKDLIFPKLGMGYNDLEPYIIAMKVSSQSPSMMTCFFSA